MQIQKIISVSKVYIGLNIHKKSWSVTIKTDIALHKTMSMVPDPEQLYTYIETHFPSHITSLTYEAGCCGFSAARHLTLNPKRFYTRQISRRIIKIARKIY